MDVNLEYEKIFGHIEYPVLFDKYDMEYQALRRQIIETPKSEISDYPLPFQDIIITSCLPIDNEKAHCIAELINRILCTKMQKKSSKDAVEIGPSKSRSNTGIKSDLEIKKHLFWLAEKDRCDASGYLDCATKFFYIRAGSLISLKDNPEYKNTSSYRNRHKLIGKYGMRLKGYIRLLEDIKCRSAKSAACYVMGKEVEAYRWRDIDGKCIYEVYPHIFI